LPGATPKHDGIIAGSRICWYSSRLPLSFLIVLRPQSSVTDLSEESPAPTPDGFWHVLMEVLRLAFPMVLGYASSTIMHFVDSMMVARVGQAEMAAASSAGVIVLALTALASGVTSCVSTFASQCLGRGEARNCSAFVWQNAFFSVAVGYVAFLAVPLVPSLFAWIGHETDVQACEAAYGCFRLIGTGFMVMGWGFCSYFQGIHRPWVTTLTTVVANLINVGANYVLIFGHFGFPAMGIAGAAIGTVLASGLHCVMLIAFVLHPWHARVHGGLDTCRFEWAKFRQLIGIGWPAGVNFFLDIASWAIFTNFLIGKFGKTALAGNMVAMQYMHLSFMPSLGLSHAASALVGRYIGQGDIARAKQRAFMAIRIAVVYMLAMGVVFFTCRYPLVRLFNQDADIVAHAALILIFAAVFQGFDALAIVSSGALRGAGDTHWTAAATITCCWGLFMPVGVSLTWFAPSLGPKGPWIAATLYIFSLGSVLFGRFLSERWTEIDIFRREAGAQPEDETVHCEVDEDRPGDAHPVDS